MLHRLAFLAGILPLTGCGVAPPGPDSFKVLRTYAFEAKVAEPQPEWNPSGYRILARAPGGFSVFEEGNNRQDDYGSDKRRETYDPQWINPAQFVFGPSTNVVRTADGQVVPPAEGLAVVTIKSRRAIEVKTLSASGYRPRVWGTKIVAQIADKLVLIDPSGKREEFADGFNAEPQRDGPGICWQETPVFAPDYWTAKPRLGKLLIRWRRGTTSEVEQAVQPRWTMGGGVVAVVIRAEPPKDAPWWKAGTTLVHIARAGAKPIEIAQDVRDPAPNPLVPVVAATAADGRLLLIDLRGRPPVEIAEKGERPRWSVDGRRLLVEEPVAGKPSARRLAVFVFKIAGLPDLP